MYTSVKDFVVRGIKESLDMFLYEKNTLSMQQQVKDRIRQFIYDCRNKGYIGSEMPIIDINYKEYISHLQSKIIDLSTNDDNEWRMEIILITSEIYRLTEYVKLDPSRLTVSLLDPITYETWSILR